MKEKSILKALLMLVSVFLLNACSESHQPSPELQRLISDKNATTPINYDEITTMTKVKAKGDYIVFEYEINADSKGRLEEIGEAMKKDNLELFKLISTSGVDKLYSTAKNEGFGIKYCYTLTKSGEELVLEFPNAILP